MNLLSTAAETPAPQREPYPELNNDINTNP